MFDIGWPELFVIAAVTLVIVGPKEIPNVLRNVMRWVKKARSLASEFQSGVDDMVREADLDKLKEEITGGDDLDLAKDIEDALDPTGDGESSLDFDMSDFEDKPLPGDDEWTDARPKSDTPENDTVNEITENSMLDPSVDHEKGIALEDQPATDKKT